MHSGAAECDKCAGGAVLGKRGVSAEASQLRKMVNFAAVTQRPRATTWHASVAGATATVQQLKCHGCHSQEGVYQQSLCGVVSSERWLTLLQSLSQGQHANAKQVCSSGRSANRAWLGLSFARGVYQQSLCGIVSSERWLTLLQSPSPVHGGMHGAVAADPTNLIAAALVKCFPDLTFSASSSISSTVATSAATVNGERASSQNE